MLATLHIPELVTNKTNTRPRTVLDAARALVTTNALSKVS